MVSLFILIFVLYDRNDFEDEEPYVFSLFLAISVLSGATGINKIAQGEEVIKLSPKYRTFLEENLTIYQQAKYLFFIQDFLKDLREKLNKAREAIK